MDGALQGACAKVWVVALGEQKLFGCVGQFQRNLAVGQQAANVFQAQIDDLDELLFAERAEDDDVVDAVQEFGFEMAVQQRS